MSCQQLSLPVTLIGDIIKQPHPSSLLPKSSLPFSLHNLLFWIHFCISLSELGELYALGFSGILSPDEAYLLFWC